MTLGLGLLHCLVNVPDTERWKYLKNRFAVSSVDVPIILEFIIKLPVNITRLYLIPLSSLC